MDKSSRLQRVIRAFDPHSPSRELLEFMVDKRQQPVPRARITFTPLKKKPSHLFGQILFPIDPLGRQYTTPLQK